MTTKEPIIIDGVDVSGCEYYDQGICNIPDVIETYDSCIDKGACYFKQLQRKKAELLKLQNTISSELPAYEKCISMARDDVYAGILDRNASDTDFCIHVIRETRNQLQRKTAECEELKKEIEENRWLKIEMDRIRKKELKTSELVDDFDKINQSLSEENNTLKAGLEKLKAQKETYQKMLNDPEVKAALIDVQTGEREVWHKLGNRAKRYKQALDEIERIITKMDADECAYGDFDCENCNSDGKCDTAAKRTVLDIIRKAKGGNNDDI